MAVTPGEFLKRTRTDLPGKFMAHRGDAEIAEKTAKHGMCNLRDARDKPPSKYAPKLLPFLNPLRPLRLGGE
jgi:hypothetical protein